VTVLCVGGAIKYTIVKGSNITDEWILENVASNIVLICPRRVGVVLGRALLWEIFDKDMSKVLLGSMVDGVKARMQTLYLNIDEHINTIKKVSLGISGAGACLQITQTEDLIEHADNAIFPTVQNVGGNDSIGGGGGEDKSAHIRALFTLIAQLKE